MISISDDIPQYWSQGRNARLPLAWDPVRVLALAGQVIELLHILLDLVPVGLDVRDGHQCDLDLHGQLHGQGT